MLKLLLERLQFFAGGRQRRRRGRRGSGGRLYRLAGLNLLGCRFRQRHFALLQSRNQARPAQLLAPPDHRPIAITIRRVGIFIHALKQNPCQFSVFTGQSILQHQRRAKIAKAFDLSMGQMIETLFVNPDVQQFMREHAHERHPRQPAQHRNTVFQNLAIARNHPARRACEAVNIAGRRGFHALIQQLLIFRQLDLDVVGNIGKPHGLHTGDHVELGPLNLLKNGDFTVMAAAAEQPPIGQHTSPGCGIGRHQPGTDMAQARLDAGMLGMGLVAPMIAHIAAANRFRTDQTEQLVQLRIAFRMITADRIAAIGSFDSLAAVMAARHEQFFMTGRMVEAIGLERENAVDRLFAGGADKTGRMILLLFAGANHFGSEALAAGRTGLSGSQHGTGPCLIGSGAFPTLMPFNCRRLERAKQAEASASRCPAFAKIQHPVREEVPMQAPDLNLLSHNRAAWDKAVAEGDQWTLPVSADEVAAARSGRVQIVLTPAEPIPAAWLGELSGRSVLCLASGGGQQGPLLAAAGARVTVFDNSPRQLEQDRKVAEREGLELVTIQGDMRDLSVLGDGSFDLIVHPISNCFVPELAPVWREAFRVLRPGGELLSGFLNPAIYSYDPLLWEENIFQLKYSIPFSTLTSLSPEELERDYLAKDEALQFGHSLSDQIGGQLAVGFVITGFYEDRWERWPVDRFFPHSLATRARKPDAGPLQST